MTTKKLMIGMDDALVATRWGVILLRTFLSFWKKGALKDIEASEKLLSLKSAGMDYSIKNGTLPVVEFKITVKKKIYLKLHPQKILLDLTCDSIPIKTFLWDSDYSIEDTKDTPDIIAPDIDAIDDGEITIKYPCVHVSYHYIHEWKLTGKVTYHSKIGDITKVIRLPFQLEDKKVEEKLRTALKGFQKRYAEGGYTVVC